MKRNSLKSLLKDVDHVLEIKGSEDILLQAFGFSHAETNLDLCTFIESEEYLNNLTPNVKVLIAKPGIKHDCETIVYTEYPRDVFYQMHEKFSRNQALQENNISKKSIIAKTAIIADQGVIIGDGVIIEDHAIIKSNVSIGENTIIRSGAIIGGAGFQMHSFKDEGLQHIEHFGSLVIGNNVEIQQNTCIDKAIFSWDKTSIGDNTKIASLVEIAHGTRIGKNNLIASGVNIGGRVDIGDSCWLGLNAVISNGIKIGSNSKISLGSIVTQNVEPNVRVTGNFAIPHDKFIENLKGQVK